MLDYDKRVNQVLFGEDAGFDGRTEPDQSFKDKASGVFHYLLQSISDADQAGENENGAVVYGALSFLARIVSASTHTNDREREMLTMLMTDMVQLCGCYNDLAHEERMREEVETKHLPRIKAHIEHRLATEGKDSMNDFGGFAIVSEHNPDEIEIVPADQLEERCKALGLEFTDEMREAAERVMSNDPRLDPQDMLATFRVKETEDDPNKRTH